MMRGRLLASLALLALLAVLPAACLEVRDAEPPMCQVTADCDAGEVCDENVCWGNPPPGMFAAVVSPPSERSADLASREVLMLPPISSDGWIEDMHLDAAVTFNGRLEALCETPCDSLTLAAEITVTRPSVFSGGPGFRKVVAVEDESFEIKLPATGPADQPFTVTVVPAGRDAPGTSTLFARQVPPLQVELAIRSNLSGSVLALGGFNLPKIAGTIRTKNGLPLPGYRVVALGRWAADQPPTEVSTVGFTGPGGNYELTLSRNLVGNVEIVARPFGPALLPELRAGAISGDSDSTEVLVLPSTSAGAEIPVSIVVDHKDTGGEIAPVAGARVLISSSFADSSGSMWFSTEGFTNTEGVVRLKLLDTPELVPGYKLSIIPPPSSKASALFAKPYVLQPTTSQRLGMRIAITGALHGADNKPVSYVSVTARPSVRFLWSLEADAQAFLGAIPTSTAVTSERGEFVLFVDHALPSGSSDQAATVWGHYDLTFEPPTAKARVPSWTRTGVELPRDASQSALALGEVQLPDAAYVRGYVYDDQNARVEGAEVRLYQVQLDPGVCEQTRFEPLGSCTIPPLLLGRAASGEDGMARLTLPRLMLPR
jgi:hypothetical protein